MTVVLPLTQYSKFLSGRSLGEIVRGDIKKLVDNELLVHIDFDGIKLATHGFCDEAFGVLLETMIKNGENIGQVGFINADEDVETIIRYVLVGRNIRDG